MPKPVKRTGKAARPVIAGSVPQINQLATALTKAAGRKLTNVEAQDLSAIVVRMSEYDRKRLLAIITQ